MLWRMIRSRYGNAQRKWDNDRMTEARTYVGLALAAAGDRQEALKHFQWVKENGNKSFVEFPAALMELRRLEQPAVDHVRKRL